MGGRATKRDLESFREAAKRDMESLKYELQAGFRAELLQQTPTFTLAMAGSVIAVGGLAFGAARLV